MCGLHCAMYYRLIIHTHVAFSQCMQTSVQTFFAKKKIMFVLYYLLAMHSGTIVIFLYLVSFCRQRQDHAGDHTSSYWRPTSSGWRTDFRRRWKRRRRMRRMRMRGRRLMTYKRCSPPNRTHGSTLNKALSSDNIIHICERSMYVLFAVLIC